MPDYPTPQDNRVNPELPWYKKHPGIAGMLGALAVLTATAIVVGIVVATGGIAAGPIVGAAAIVGSTISAGALTGTGALILGASGIVAGIIGVTAGIGAGIGKLVDYATTDPLLRGLERGRYDLLYLEEGTGTKLNGFDSEDENPITYAHIHNKDTPIVPDSTLKINQRLVNSQNTPRTRTPIQTHTQSIQSTLTHGATVEDSSSYGFLDYLRCCFPLWSKRNDSHAPSSTQSNSSSPNRPRFKMNGGGSD